MDLGFFCYTHFPKYTERPDNNLKLRPAPFSQRHVDAYRAREADGKGTLAPEELEDLDITGNLALEATQEIELSEDDLWDEIFREYDDPTRPVTVDTFVDFGSSSSLSATGVLQLFTRPLRAPCFADELFCALCDPLLGIQHPARNLAPTVGCWHTPSSFDPTADKLVVVSQSPRPSR